MIHSARAVRYGRGMEAVAEALAEPRSRVILEAREEGELIESKRELMR